MEKLISSLRERLVVHARGRMTGKENRKPLGCV